MIATALVIWLITLTYSAGYCFRLARLPTISSRHIATAYTDDTEGNQRMIQQKLAHWTHLKKEGLLTRSFDSDEDVEELDELVAERFTACPPIGHNVEKIEHTVCSAHLFGAKKKLAKLAARFVEDGDGDTVRHVKGLYSLLQSLATQEPSTLDTVESVMLDIARMKPPAFGPTGPAQRSAERVAGGVRHQSTPATRPKTTITAASVAGHGGDQGHLDCTVSRKQVAALVLYLTTCEKWSVDSRRIKDFAVKYVLQLFSQASSCEQAATVCRDLLLERGTVSADAFLPGELCAAIHRAYSEHPPDLSLVTDLSNRLQRYNAQIARHPLYATNLILRTLARYHQVGSIIIMLRALRVAAADTAAASAATAGAKDGRTVGSLAPNSEGLEMLTNALVRSVGKGVKALSMSELPRGGADIPEVVFIGRSNVGKSSLVNALLNRKALASTSATPGHTKHFHFFAINEAPASRVDEKSPKNYHSGGLAGRNKKVAGAVTVQSTRECRISGATEPVQGLPPVLRFVDVPGMGYAEAPTPADGTPSSQGTQSPRKAASSSSTTTTTTSSSGSSSSTSEGTPKDHSRTWRGLLDRYLRVRDPLRVVFHLVDARHGITSVDQEVLGMVKAALQARVEHQTSSFQFYILLTKADKVEGEALQQRRIQTKQLAAQVLGQEVPVLVTAAATKYGLEEAWAAILAGSGLTTDSQRVASAGSRL